MVAWLKPNRLRKTRDASHVSRLRTKIDRGGVSLSRLFGEFGGEVKLIRTHSVKAAGVLPQAQAA